MPAASESCVFRPFMILASAELQDPARGIEITALLAPTAGTAGLFMAVLPLPQSILQLIFPLPFSIFFRGGGSSLPTKCFPFWCFGEGVLFRKISRNELITLPRSVWLFTFRANLNAKAIRMQNSDASFRLGPNKETELKSGLS